MSSCCPRDGFSGCSETITNISIDEKPRPSSGGLEKEGLTIGAAHEDEKRTVGRPGMKKEALPAKNKNMKSGVKE